MLMRALLAAIAAVLGSAIGYGVHQAMGTSQPAADEASTAGVGDTDITIAAPLTNAGVAFVAGLLTGRRAPITAFIVGVTISAIFGTKLDAMLPIGQSRSPSSTNSLHSSA